MITHLDAFRDGFIINYSDEKLNQLFYIII